MPSSESQDDVHFDYLNTLDGYQAHMQQLCTDLSRAFIALAAANVSCPPPASDGRYGAEQYARRQSIVPTRGLRIACAGREGGGELVWEGIALPLSPAPSSAPSPAPDVATSSGLRRRRRRSDGDVAQSRPRADAGDMTQSPRADDGDVAQSPPRDDPRDDDDMTQPPRDDDVTSHAPLRLFHPLPPSSLRAAAAAFSASLASVPTLATTLHRLHVLAAAMSLPPPPPQTPPPQTPAPPPPQSTQNTQTAPGEGSSPTAAFADAAHPQPTPTNPALAQETTEHVYKLLAQAPSFPLPPSPLDARSGYIHLCTPPQAVAVARRAFPDDCTMLWVLKVPLGRIAAGAVRWEAASDDGGDGGGDGGERFPHLYGTLERDAVDAVGRIARRQNGPWDWGSVVWDSS